MANDSKAWRNRHKRNEGQKALRVLTAAATRINLNNEADVNRQRDLRQMWQLDAFTYRNSIGELRYAVNFLANCAARMRLFVAALPDDGETDVPVDITKLAEDPANGVPPELVEACASAVRDLGNGRTAMAGHLHSASTNISLAGEAYLLGQEDPLTGRQTWSIRSVSEIVTYKKKIYLRETPMDSTGALGMTPLDPDTTIISRMWKPDPQFRLQADSAVRAILNECESLLILRRMIRSTGRSRLAGRGILAIPDEVSIVRDNDDNDDPEADDFMADLIDAMITPISNEGDASAVVPLVLKGPAEYLNAIRLIEMADTFDVNAGATRTELVGVIATGLDLPKEVIVGMTDLNHWTAWAVDDNTFRNHVEPHVITLVDCFTDAFLRPYLATSGLPQAIIDEWLPRIMFWYDPQELVTKPDQTANATLLHTAIAISDAAYRRTLGFAEEDAPTPAEVEIRMIRTTKTYPPNLLMALMHELDPTLGVPPVTTAGTIPGIKPGAAGGADVPVAAPPVTPGAPATPPSPDSVAVTPTPPAGISGDSEGPPETPALNAAGLAGLSDEDKKLLLGVLKAEFYAKTGKTIEQFTAETTPAVVAAGGRQVKAKAKAKPSDKSVRLSRKLTQIDSELRTKVQTAANAAMLRQLEKAGAKVRQKVAPNAELRKSIAKTRNEHVLMALGKDAVERTGLTASVLMATDWASFKEQFLSWTKLAQRQALATAAQLAGVDEFDSHVEAVAAMSDNADAAWTMLENSMNTLAMHLPYSPDPALDEADVVASLNPDTLIPTGVVRCALAVAGGASPQDFGIVRTQSGAEVPAIPLGTPIGGVATGGTIGGLLTSAGAATDQYEWVHGPSDKPFEPHEALDGYEFSSFTDDGLANDGAFPDNDYFFPGDHVGCLCDVTPLWVTDEDVQAAMANAGDGDDES